MKGLQEAVFTQTQQVDRETFFSDSQGNIFAYDLPPGIHGANNVFRAALHFKRNYMIVGHNDGSYVQIVRSHRGYYKTARIEKNDGTSAAQGIPGGTSRGSHYQSICPICIKK